MPSMRRRASPREDSRSEETDTTRSGDAETREEVEGEHTFTGQLRAFAAWLRDGIPMPTDAWEAVENMRFIDAVYQAAGLPVRGEKR